MFHCAKLNLNKYSLLKDVHLWKIFTPEKYSPLEIFTPWKCSPWKYSPLKNINVNIELLSQWTVWVSQVGSAALEKVLSILSLYSIWCWRKCFGTAAPLNVQIRMEDGMDEIQIYSLIRWTAGCRTRSKLCMTSCCSLHLRYRIWDSAAGVKITTHAIVLNGSPI